MAEWCAWHIILLCRIIVWSHIKIHSSMWKIQPGDEIADGQCLSPNWVLCMTHHLIMEKTCVLVWNKIKIHSGRWKIQPGHKLSDRLTDIQTLTLTFGEVDWVMCMTHHLVLENIVTLTLGVADGLITMTNPLITENTCVKYNQNPFRHIEDTARTHNFGQADRQTNYDLDVGRRWLADVHDTSSFYRE